MQRRSTAVESRTPLDTLLSRGDAEAWDYLTERLTLNEEVDPADAPAPSDAPADPRARETRQHALEVEG